MDIPFVKSCTDHCKHITITPINKQLKSKSHIDYEEQLERTKMGEAQWVWDDSKYNKAQMGEYFAFLFYGKKLVIHQIMRVKPPSERLPSWSMNVGQTTRNVLELSDPIVEISWDEWTTMGGPETHLGTYRTNDLSIHRPMIYEKLRNLSMYIKQ